jgi:hypothetical protein
VFNKIPPDGSDAGQSLRSTGFKIPIATPLSEHLPTVILATQEAEIRRIVVRNQPQTNSTIDPILKTPDTKKGYLK